MNRITAGKGQRAKGKGDDKRRRRRLLVAMVIVGGVSGWLISMLPESRGSQQQTAETRRTQRTATARPTGERGQSPEVTVPGEPFQRCATKALRGEYGPLEEWQRCAYIWGIAKRVRCCGLGKVTSYGPWESPQMSGGPTTATGLPVSQRFCAANPEIAFGTIIWTEYGLRYVQDRGGWVKLGWVRGVGRVTSALENANLDYYSDRELATLREVPWAVVKRAQKRQVRVASSE